ncbi:nucleotidyltransferase domain-containing protein [Roseivirga pacifica]|uniref:nucleotidyltransferase domain-containing protein n=1 Tax=Roseivirga pacifica TaxID=1267423 RepID=UPI00209411AE|nr:nucleotidyltransferase [Roseivirga pacifica]MCO6360376.1 nucleotidyltransferase [Roseivirga pacifica]MCO6368265.1 nucleotidyltransferase [Roseivirga pacifica]MCO6372407.1 nucleotidyltransferase [Roseivirga pacifica]MCO6376465.1 nucleotidyltransferase [Roseivirga pacifica]MCO6378255.1 nucleotidyltransferase [Roseivirga pacifica]
MIQLNDAKTQLDDLLARIAEGIQLDDTRKKRMESAYNAIQELLDEDEVFFKNVQFEIYPQGSMRIGTTVKPTAKNEFDLDIVIHLIVDWAHFNPQKIYNELKRVLTENGNYKDKVELKNRCIRLDYAGDFHMDILPGCQETEYDSNKLVVPDRKLGNWASSNPRGYADWFTDRADRVKMSLLEKAFSAQDLPADDFAKKKPLQRAVQLIKMYRDQYFKDHQKMATSSVILTTIAGQFYDGEDSIYDTIDNVIQRIKNELANKIGYYERLVILNPVNHKEDFTDKWARDKEPELYEYFKKFISHLDDQWQKLKEESGVVQERHILTELFGESAFQAAQKSQADYIEKARKSNVLGMNKKTGTLTSSTITGAKSVVDNTFFGGHEE